MAALMPRATRALRLGHVPGHVPGPHLFCDSLCLCPWFAPCLAARGALNQSDSPQGRVLSLLCVFVWGPPQLGCLNLSQQVLSSVAEPEKSVLGFRSVSFRRPPTEAAHSLPRQPRGVLSAPGLPEGQ